jgi:hypothetical protein
VRTIFLRSHPLQNLGQMLKPLPAIYEPDERFQHLSFHDQAAGIIRPIRADDIHGEVARIELNASVPAEVRYQFGVARNAYVCSWFLYDLAMLAEEHCYIVLEMALRHRAKSEGLTRTSTLKPYLQLALNRGWLRKDDLKIPGSPTARPMSFLVELPRLRDRLLHGRIHLSPDFTLLIMRKCADLLNKLYAV